MRAAIPVNVEADLHLAFNSIAPRFARINWRYRKPRDPFTAAVQNPRHDRLLFFGG